MSYKFKAASSEIGIDSVCNQVKFKTGKEEKHEFSPFCEKRPLVGYLGGFGKNSG